MANGTEGWTGGRRLWAVEGPQPGTLWLDAPPRERLGGSPAGGSIVDISLVLEARGSAHGMWKC